MTDRALSVPFETTGKWFLPEEPSRIIPGALKYTPALTELELQEAFRPVRGTYRVGDTQAYPLIYGSTTDGELATLFNVAVRDSTSILGALACAAGSGS